MIKGWYYKHVIVSNVIHSHFRAFTLRHDKIIVRLFNLIIYDFRSTSKKKN
jgi:hypothetical protein